MPSNTAPSNTRHAPVVDVAAAAALGRGPAPLLHNDARLPGRKRNVQGCDLGQRRRLEGRKNGGHKDVKERRPPVRATLTANGGPSRTLHPTHHSLRTPPASPPRARQ